LLTKRRSFIAFVLVVPLALLGATYSAFTSFEQPNEQALLSSGSERASAAPCSFSFSETSGESRTASMFGGVKVETGEVECNGEYFIISQTSNADGDVLSVKKKRA
jgi:hypothetical protein